MYSMNMLINISGFCSIRRTTAWIVFLSSLLFYGKAISQSITSEYPKHFGISVANPLPVQRENVMVVINAYDLKQKIKGFNERAFVVMDGEKEIPSQYNSDDRLNMGI